MQHTYAEMEPNGSYAHLAHTIDYYLSHETPLWWVEVEETAHSDQHANQPRALSNHQLPPVACLWLGTAIDQMSGKQHAHVFLLYVTPEHRGRGIGSALMHHAEDFARARGDHQLGLQVFQSNQPALKLYYSLGFQPQSLWMIKRL